MEQVSGACDSVVKLEQIRRRLLRQAALLIQQFGRFYDAGSVGSRDETLKRALATVNAVGAAIRTEDGYRAIGHFVAALSAQESGFYELYLDVASLEGVEASESPGRATAALPDVFADLEPDKTKLPACLSLITGPSKTGDIELKLVTGVHGPGELHVVVLDG